MLEGGIEGEFHDVALIFMSTLIEVPSPTEVVTDMEEDKGDVIDDGHGAGLEDLNMEDPVPSPTAPADGSSSAEGVRSKKRERDRRARASAGVKEEEEAEQSPSKRAHEGGDDDSAPLSGKALKELFAQHLSSVKHEMQLVWGDVRGRIDSMEKTQASTHGEIAKFGGRLAIAEKDNLLQQTELARHKDQIGGLENAVEDLKHQLAEIKVQGPRGDGPPAHQPPLRGRHENGGLDPWAQYLDRRNGRPQLAGDVPLGAESAGDTGAGRRAFLDRGEPNRDGLSEEDKCSLIIGGWLQDTKREIIETEAADLLMTDPIKQFLDVEKVTVFGPRKSFALIRFKERAGENFTHVKERMWGVIKAVNAMKHIWPSTGGAGNKPAWTSFLKSRTARQRSAHASMLRRVAIDLAGDAKTTEGAPKFPEALLGENYDVDWAAGTIWRQQWKLGSSTHRQPKGEVKLMNGGWVDITALSNATGATASEVLLALERELNM